MATVFVQAYGKFISKMVKFWVLQGKQRAEFGPTQVWCMTGWVYPSALLLLVVPMSTLLCLCDFDTLQCHTTRHPQSSRQEKTFSLRLMGANSASCPQRGQNNILVLQFMSLHYLINFILLIYSDWLTVTLKASWVEGPIYYESLFQN